MASPGAGPPAEGTGAGPAPQYCYRHPDRETYVTCTRCGRPICSECMRPAPVGYQCPDDVAAGARQARAPRTIAGGRADRRGPPVVTIALVALNVLGYVLEGAPGIGNANFGNQFIARFEQVNALIAHGDYYRLLTGAFLHASLLHILLNMVVLVLLGPRLEEVLGPARFLALYVLSALGGATAVYLFNSPNQAVVGASGALFGMFAAFYLLARRIGGDTSGILITIGINLALTFTISNISVFGHLGGLVTGAAVGAIYTLIPPRQRALQWAGLLAILVVLLVAVAARTAQLSPTVSLGPLPLS